MATPVLPLNRWRYLSKYQSYNPLKWDGVWKIKWREPIPRESVLNILGCWVGGRGVQHFPWARSPPGQEGCCDSYIGARQTSILFLITLSSVRRAMLNNSASGREQGLEGDLLLARLTPFVHIRQSRSMDETLAAEDYGHGFLKAGIRKMLLLRRALSSKHKGNWGKSWDALSTVRMERI